jgi:hypothetical protein
MKTILLAILVSFAVSYATVRALQTPAVDHGGSSQALAPAQPSEDLQNSIAQLMEANQALSARVDFLENQPTGGVRLPAAGDWVSKQEFLALQTEVREATTAGPRNVAPSVDLTDPQYREQLGTAIQELRKAETIERIETQQMKQAAGLEQRLAKMQTQLGLNPTQVLQMRSALEAKMEMDGELTRRWEEGESMETLGQIKAENGSTHEAELARILTPAQLEQHRGSSGGKGK